MLFLGLLHIFFINFFYFSVVISTVVRVNTSAGCLINALTFTIRINITWHSSIFFSKCQWREHWRGWWKWYIIFVALTRCNLLHSMSLQFLNRCFCQIIITLVVMAFILIISVIIDINTTVIIVSIICNIFVICRGSNVCW